MMMSDYWLGELGSAVDKSVREFNPPTELEGLPLNAYEKVLYRKGFFQAIDEIYAALYELRTREFKDGE